MNNEPNKYSFPEIAQAAIRSLSSSGDFDKDRDWYRRAVVTLLSPFAQIMGEMYGEPLDEHPEISENEPYDLWMLLQEVRDNRVEVDTQSAGVMEYFFDE